MKHTLAQASLRRVSSWFAKNQSRLPHNLCEVFLSPSFCWESVQQLQVRWFAIEKRQFLVSKEYASILRGTIVADLVRVESCMMEDWTIRGSNDEGAHLFDMTLEDPFHRPVQVLLLLQALREVAQPRGNFEHACLQKKGWWNCSFLRYWQMKRTGPPMAGASSPHHLCGVDFLLLRNQSWLHMSGNEACTNWQWEQV